MDERSPAIPVEPVASPATPTQHVTVCVCTYKRPDSLLRLLRSLAAQATGGGFSHSVVVADNDQAESARDVVARFAADTPMTVRYCVEPRQNIALARNKAVENAAGDFIAIIDDDEEAASDWLLRLMDALRSSTADGALGPVIPRFATPAPDWIVRGKFFERPSHPSGMELRWKQTRTGNVLLRGRIFADPANRFRAEYGGGSEDTDFFRRMIAQGMRFVWCAEARVYESVPPERCRRAYLLKRALQRGRAAYNQEPYPIAVSLVAVPAYALALPVVLIAGQHLFMRYLIKECSHLGRIVALLGGKRGTAAA